jgi:hypothetical protein
LSLAPTRFLRRLHRLLCLHSQFVKIQHEVPFYGRGSRSAGYSLRTLAESLFSILAKQNDKI